MSAGGALQESNQQLRHSALGPVRSEQHCVSDRFSDSGEVRADVRRSARARIGKMLLGTPARLLLCAVALWAPWHTCSDALTASPRTIFRPTLIRTVSDANLVYEFLLSGLVIDKDNNAGIRDQEMASMRQGRVFLSLINDNVPKTVPAMEDLLGVLEEEDRSLNQDQFETLILGLVYSAYQVHGKKSQQQAWGSVLGRFANATLRQLRKS